MRNRSRLAATVFVVGSLVAVFAEGRTPARGTAKPVQAAALEVHHFENMRDMVLQSTVVVEAHVGDVRRGRTQGTGHDAIVFREYILNVESVLRGSVDAERLLVEEEGWSDTGNPLIVNNVAPTEVGDGGIYFLTAKDTPPYYALISSQGRYLEVNGELRGSNHEDRLVQAVQRMSLEALRRAVQDT